MGPGQLMDDLPDDEHPGGFEFQRVQPIKPATVGEHLPHQYLGPNVPVQRLIGGMQTRQDDPDKAGNEQQPGNDRDSPAAR